MSTTLIQSVETSRIASGQTPPGNTDWKPYQGGTGGIFVDVSTKCGKFVNTPAYITSIGGITNHWSTTGATSIYQATPTSFRVYVRYDNGSAITPQQANQMNWHINWIGMEL